MDRVISGPRMLTTEEKQELRRDMAESSAWVKAELKRRRDAKNQKALSMKSKICSNESAKIDFSILFGSDSLSGKNDG